jgi:hypothetical protein
MDDIKRTTGIVNTAAIRFQWLGKVVYKDRRYAGTVLACSYKEAVEEILLDALTEWDISSPVSMDFLFDYVNKHPKSLSLELKDSLESIVERYALSKKYNDPTTAMDQCLIASKRLLKFLLGLGFAAKQVNLMGPKTDFPMAVPKWRRISVDYWKHHVVSVDNTVCDLTFRQFDPAGPYPFFTTVDEVKNKWKEISFESNPN